MKGHVIKFANLLKMYPRFRKNELTKYRFADSVNTFFFVMVSDVAQIMSTYELDVLLTTHVSYFDTYLVPVTIGPNTKL